jgi:hypothetical protein
MASSNRIDPLKNENCPHCTFLHTFFSTISDMTNREYWIFTEMFVYLHDGKDYCNRNNSISEVLHDYAPDYDTEDK